MCARVGNQRSRVVVTARVLTDAVQSLRRQRRDLDQSTYPVPLGRSGLILLSSGIRFWVSREVYLCVF
jgi:pyridoxine/pyridoxamine 5'-phosphate oxidase